MKKLLYTINCFIILSICLTGHAMKKKSECATVGELCKCPGSNEPLGLCLMKNRRLQCDCTLNTMSQEEFEVFSSKHNGNYPTDASCARKPPFGFDDKEITQLMSNYGDLLYKDQLFNELVPDRKAVNNALVATSNQIKDDLQSLYGLDVKRRTADWLKIKPLLAIYESRQAPKLCEEHFKKILAAKLAAAGIKISLTLTSDAEKMLRDICQKNEKRTNLDPCYCNALSKYSDAVNIKAAQPGICMVNTLTDTGKLRCHCE